ncbi:MAG: hypothetical protein WA760_07980, partial [Pseudolabrys sp.]
IKGCGGFSGWQLLALFYRADRAEQAGRVGTSPGTCKQDARFNDEVIGLEGPHALVRSLGVRPPLPQQKT